jgi:hypothetical protein
MRFGPRLQDGASLADAPDRAYAAAPVHARGSARRPVFVQPVVPRAPITPAGAVHPRYVGTRLEHVVIVLSRAG